MLAKIHADVVGVVGRDLTVVAGQDMFHAIVVDFVGWDLAVVIVFVVDDVGMNLAVVVDVVG